MWGRFLWPFIHLTALRYDQQELTEDARQHIRDWFLNLPAFLPCPACVPHATRHIKEFPPPFFSVAAQKHKTTASLFTEQVPLNEKQSPLFAWTVEFHNEVNERTGKRIFTLQEAWRSLRQHFFEPLQFLHVATMEEWSRQHHALYRYLQDLDPDPNADTDTAAIPLPCDTADMAQAPILFEQYCRDVDALNRLRLSLQRKGIPVGKEEEAYHQKVTQAHAFIEKQQLTLERLKREEAQLNKRLATKRYQVKKDQQVQMMIYVGLGVCLLAIGCTTFFVFRKGCALNVRGAGGAGVGVASMV
jgi:hypothetical protein